jgi:tetratricopeptide (TPR) repeat protein
VTVFIDSRSEVYGEALLAEFRRIKNLEGAAGSALDRHGVELVLVRQNPYPVASKRNQELLRVVEDDPHWGLLYVDDQSVLYARRDLAGDLPAFFERFVPGRFHPDDPYLADPKFEAEVRRAVSRAPDSAFLRFALAAALRAQGRRREALAELAAGWAANPAYAAVPQLAGEIAAAGGDTAQARRWFERALEAAPTWRRPRVALGSLSRSAE